MGCVEDHKMKNALRANHAQGNSWRKPIHAVRLFMPEGQIIMITNGNDLAIAMISRYAPWLG